MNTVNEWAALAKSVPPHVMAAARKHAARTLRQAEAEQGVAFARAAARSMFAQLAAPLPHEDLASMAAVIATAEMLKRR